jgi:hypothetical protein
MSIPMFVFLVANHVLEVLTRCPLIDKRTDDFRGLYNFERVGVISSKFWYESGGNHQIWSPYHLRWANEHISFLDNIIVLVDMAVIGEDMFFTNHLLQLIASPWKLPQVDAQPLLLQPCSTHTGHASSSFLLKFSYCMILHICRRAV